MLYLVDGACYEQQLNVQKDEVEDLLIALILEGKVEGRIDQVAQRLELDSKYVFLLTWVKLVLTQCSRASLERKRYAALDKWTNALESVHNSVVAKNQTGNRGTDTTYSHAPDPFSSPLREINGQWAPR